MDVDGLHVIGLDSIVEHETGGAFPEDQADWLRSVLDDRPTLIFLHHPLAARQLANRSVDDANTSGHDGRRGGWM